MLFYYEKYKECIKNNHRDMYIKYIIIFTREIKNV